MALLSWVVSWVCEDALGVVGGGLDPGKDCNKGRFI